MSRFINNDAVGFRIIESVAGASLMIAVTGFSWAIAAWAPFALVRTGGPFSSYVIQPLTRWAMIV